MISRSNRTVRFTHFRDWNWQQDCPISGWSERREFPLRHATRRTRLLKSGVSKMNKIAFAAAALLIATGSAFAGSDHYDPNNANQSAVTAPAGNVDNTVTGSIRKFNKFEQ